MKFGRNLQSIVIAFVLIVSLIVFCMMFFYPTLKDMRAKREEMKVLQKKVDNVTKTIVNGMKQFKREFKDLENEYEALSKKLPSKDSYPELLNQISKKTENLKVDVMARNRLDEVLDDELKLKRIPMIVDIVIDYKTLGDYLLALEEVGIAVNIRRLIVNKDEKNLASPALRVDMELETYISLVE
ncbi:MAG: type 4a pilus biogenesis protein PilO [Candidatus Aureabacteria bacterium]|nr:type 4a pilus biogenesis protein PilO [Candidatus Paceibacterota bacterium]MCK5708683.1 type 4a pilus biogenesis protein PilO [Candidatus Auribacterota bacterium]